MEDQQDLKYREHLEMAALSQGTVKEYLRYYTLLKGIELTQDSVNLFVKDHNHMVGRASLKSYLTYLNRSDLTIVKQRGRKVQKIPRYFSKEDIEKVINGIKKERDQLIIRLLFDTGVRASELLNLYKRNIDMDRCEIRGIGKGNREYIQKFSSRSKKMLEKWIEPLTFDQKLFPFSRHNLYNIISKSFKKVIGKPANPHSLRHSHATHLRKRGKDLDKIQSSLRHTNLATTSIYTHIDKAKTREELIEEFE